MCSPFVDAPRSRQPTRHTFASGLNSGAVASGMALSYDEISEILKIIDESSCDEFVLETGDIKLVVRRRGATAPGQPVEPAITTSVSLPTGAPMQSAARPTTTNHVTAN